jgi:hypothetical protein
MQSFDESLEDFEQQVGAISVIFSSGVKLF